MNDIAATMLAHLTSSLRFEGSLNVDLNEVSMNLVPFRRFSLSILDSAWSKVWTVLLGHTMQTVADSMLSTEVIRLVLTPLPILIIQLV